MQASTIMIAAEGIVTLAQNTFVENTVAVPGLRCEWGSGRETCKVVAACWESLRQHYHQHLCGPGLKTKKEKYGHVQCRLPRCSAAIQTSVEALRHHIETSHLSRVTIPCPINGCRPSAALRSTTILKHFLDEHSQLNGTVVQLPSDLLRPSWRPFYPCKAVQPPPPLPPNPKPGCILVTSAPCAMRNRKHLMRSLPAPSPSSTPFTSPRKQSQRQIPKKAEEDEDELSIPNFGPLPGYPESACLQPQDLVVWRRPTVFDVDVARPQGMHDGPIQETPISILYDVFARRVDELERKGLLSTS